MSRDRDGVVIRRSGRVEYRGEEAGAVRRREDRSRAYERPGGGPRLAGRFPTALAAAFALLRSVGLR